MTTSPIVVAADLEPGDLIVSPLWTAGHMPPRPWRVESIRLSQVGADRETLYDLELCGVANGHRSRMTVTDWRPFTRWTDGIG